jgi:hypothetical protein
VRTPGCAAGGPLDGPALMGLRGWPDRGYYCAMGLYDVLDVATWKQTFRDLLLTLAPRD